MNFTTHRVAKCFRFVNLIVVALLGLTPFSVSSQTAESYEALPPLLSGNATPLVMLALSNDHQLWIKAYTDYTDLDGDGNLDTFYIDSFDYYGYFNSGFCYTYTLTSGVGLFSPNGTVDSGGGHKCALAAGDWSGNFLNWASMTRMDIVRKVLFGGLRVVDTASTSVTPGQTVLQRAFIPADNHAFVKIVKQSEIDGNISDYTPIAGQTVISLCSVTDYVTGSNDRSKDLSILTNPPLLKVVAGNYFAWSGSERNQCQFTNEGGGGSNPGGNSAFSPVRGDLLSLSTSAEKKDELQVRVAVCVPGQDEAQCRAYQNNAGVFTYKPSGLLQVHGELGDVKFGLITGSYEKNDAGGALRKNISFLGYGADSADQEVDMTSGIFVNQTTSDDGIVNTLNRMRVQGWDYSDTFYYDCNPHSISTTDFITSADANRQCRDWGNPIAELYLEALRYFAGQTTATTAFDADDSSIVPGLDKVTWTDPMIPEEFCSKCSIVLLSTGLNMFDGDHLGSASDIPGLVVVDETNAVGVAEGINGGNYIVGNSSGGTAGTCDAKTVTLGNVTGICPEVPQLQGTYHLAGLAKFAHISDLRTPASLGDPDTYPEKQTINTFTVALAESLPSFEITTTNGNSVNIVPGCRSHTNGSASLTASGWADCSLVDLTVAERKLGTNAFGEPIEYGRLVISWEDSYWGNDYDMDGYSVIEYCTATGTGDTVRGFCPNYTNDERTGYPRRSWRSAATGEIQIRVSNIGGAAGNAMRFGYVMNGSVGEDGTYFDLLRPGDTNFNSVALTGTDTNAVLWGPSVEKFSAAAGTPALLKNPLWYAAKYGQFDDTNGNNLPDLQTEFDKFNLAGAPNPDGIPDAYFPVSNPGQLEERLNKVFRNIRAEVAAGNAAAVIANSGAGEGALFQAIYRPEVLESSTGESVSWVGILNAFFIDKFGNLRQEGGTPNGVLEATDPIISIFYDSLAEAAKFQEYTFQSDGTVGAAIGTARPLEDLNPIWSATDELNNVSNYTSQRNYSSLANTGRYIFTTLDENADGVIKATSVGTSINTPDQVDFDDVVFAPSNGDNFRFLGLQSAKQTESTNLVNFIRGQEGLPNSRTRTISSTNETHLLGDIIHSSPKAVSAPREAYDSLYRDDTYRAFKQKYKNRRQMVYVGANDGMVHAFNAGFYDVATSTYNTSISYTDIGGTSVTTTAHPLGSELWAYVPHNLLPHLQWLKNPTYSHVFYVDGAVQTFDVNIFPYDKNAANPTSVTHPYGWGTIMVVGFRLGGGDYSLDPDGDKDADTSDDITMRSAYVVFDITDPEQPPKVIAEITDPEMGFTTSEPNIVKYRKVGSNGSFVDPETNEWFLVFGSGPAGTDTPTKAAAFRSAQSSQNAQLFSFNLSLDALELSKLPTTDTESFVGGVTPADWDNDYQDDVVYFGTVGGTPATATGRLKRGELNLNTGATASLGMSFSNVLNVNSQPFSSRPTILRDAQRNYWVYSGTGRFYVAEDNVTTGQQSFYGVKEPKDSLGLPTYAAVPKSSLFDTTGIKVYSDGSLVGAPTGIDTFNDAKRAVAAAQGWHFNLSGMGARNVSRAAIALQSVVFIEYQPSLLQCEPEGESFLYAVDFQVGLPGPYGPLGTDPSDTFNTGEYVPTKISIGDGLGSELTVGSGSGSGSDGVTLIGTMSTGAIVQPKVAGAGAQGQRQSWREIPITW